MKLFRRLACVALILCVFAQCETPLESSERHVKIILDEIVQTHMQVRKFARNGRQPCAEGKCVFVAFWDFDGTILHGDITEGLSEDGVVRFEGLQESVMKAGLAPRYSGAEGFQRYRNEYLQMERDRGYRVAYGFIARALAGGSAEKIGALAAGRFEARFAPYYFQSSIDIFRRLEADGIRNYIVSASPELYVKAAAPSLGVGPDRLYGIATQIDGDTVSDRLVEPVHWGDGKIERIRLILDQIRATENADHVYAIAAFGNSPHSDGPFLKYIAEQRLPARFAISVMINGEDGRDPEIPGVRYVVQREVVGADSAER